MKKYVIVIKIYVFDMIVVFDYLIEGYNSFVCVVKIRVNEVFLYNIMIFCIFL